MCTQQQAKEAVTTALMERDHEGFTIIEREVQSIVTKAVAKLSFRFGIATLVLAFGIGGTWATLAQDVRQNTEARNAGDRYTKEDGENLKAYSDQRDEELERRITAQDTRLIRIEDKLDRILERI